MMLQKDRFYGDEEIMFGLNELMKGGGVVHKILWKIRQCKF